MSMNPNALARKLPTGYLLGFGIISLILAGIAVYVVSSHVALKALEFPLIGAIVIVVIAIQAVVFMHLGSRKVYSAFFAYGAFLAILIALAPEWVVTAAPAPKVVKLTATQEMAMGQQIVTQTCTSCHTINGSGGTIGPNLNQVFAGTISANILAPTSNPNSATWLAQWISDPANVWTGAKMPDLGLSPQQVHAVVIYLDAHVK